MTNPPWWIDELAFAGEEHLAADYVSGYERKSAYDPAEDIDALQAHGLGKDSVVIDFGAGTGVFATAVAPFCREVIAVEIAPAMFVAMQQRIRESGTENVGPVQTGLLGYEHLGDPVDVVFSRNTLHHLPDFWKSIALVRIANLLKPGGMLRPHDLVYSFDPHEADEVFQRWLGNAVENEADGYTAADLATHIQTEHSTYSWLLEPMLERAGFEIRDAAHRGSRTYSVYDCVRR